MKNQQTDESDFFDVEAEILDCEVYLDSLEYDNLVD